MYADIDPEERDNNILVGIGMVGLTPFPDRSDNDDSKDDKPASYVFQNIL